VQHHKDLKSRCTDQESFYAATNVPKKFSEKHTIIVKISGRHIGVLPWATVNNVADLHDRLKIYDIDLTMSTIQKS